MNDWDSERNELIDCNEIVPRYYPLVVYRAIPTILRVFSIAHFFFQHL